MMKRYLLSIAASLIFACGVATAAVEPTGMVIASYDQCLVGYHCDAVVASRVAGPVMQLPGMDAYRSTLFRSDMRVASAGLVFNRAMRTLGEIQAESTAPS